MRGQPLLQIERQGVVFRGSARDLERLRTEFDERHCLVLPEFFPSHMLEIIQRRLGQAAFRKDLDPANLAVEQVMRDPITQGLLVFLLSSAPLFAYVEQITGCSPIGSFIGRVYRMLPGPEYYDTWHDDCVDDRLIAISVNLSKTAYQGGRTQFRRKGEDRVVSQVANTGLGDALIFRIAPFLEHRVERVLGTEPKTAGVGWFRSRPRVDEILQAMVGMNDSTRALDLRPRKNSFA